MSDRLIGAVLVAISATAFGSMAIFGVWAHADGVDTPTVLLVRFGLAALILIAVLYARGTKLPEPRRLLAIAGMGGIGYVGQSYCFFLALEHADAGLVALLLYLYPALVAILAAGFLHERLGPLAIVALVCSLVGTGLVVGGGTGRPLGFILGISAAIIYSIYITVGTVVTDRIDPIAVSAVVCTAAALVCGAIVVVRALAGHAASIPATTRGWVSLVAIALIGTVVAILFFFAGLAKLGGTKTSVISTLEPVVTVGLAVWLLGESVSVVQALGGTVVIVAVVTLALASNTTSEQPAVPTV